MLGLPTMELIRPRTLDEALAALAEDGAMLIAGGTDLLPNLKHGLHAPRRLVSLRRVEELRGIRPTKDRGLHIGASVTLSELARDEAVRALYPALADAASLVAGPQIRNMGTIGGNLCLDTRCVYFNQTHFWRQALGYCIKKDGHLCHVVPNGRRCTAAFSADTPGPLIAYGATVHLRALGGGRDVPIEKFFVADGADNKVRESDEVVTGVTLPPPGPRFHSAYLKVRPRAAIDFPALSISVAVALDTVERVRRIAVVVGALGAKPRAVGQLDGLAKGRTFDATLRERIADVAHGQARPLRNIGVDPDWRHDVLKLHVLRAFDAMRHSVSPD